jgi:hypothetical protein
MKTQKEIEQLAENQCHTMESRFGFAWGYEQCQKDMADKKCYHPLPYRLAKSDVNFECTLCGKFI